MLCPCCGAKILLGALECGCGAHFVGEPLDEEPIKIRRFGPAINAALSFVIVTGAALIFTRWLAFAGVLAIWSSLRAMRLSRRDPNLYGGYRAAAVTLTVSVTVGLVAIAYTIAYIPRFLENRQIRKTAATNAAMYHIANLLEDYKSKFGSYPTNYQELKKATTEQLPPDYWNKSIKYQTYTEAIATSSVGKQGIPFNNFELRSAGPDEKMGTDDDIIMRDGIFFTNAEVKKQPVAQDSAVR